MTWKKLQRSAATDRVRMPDIERVLYACAPHITLIFFGLSFLLKSKVEKAADWAVFKKQAGGQAFYSWALNLDRFIWTGFFQGHF